MSLVLASNSPFRASLLRNAGLVIEIEASEVDERAVEAPLLEAERLGRRFRMGGDVIDVLRGVSLTVQRGEWLAIQGASGSGKSTLLHLLGGLDRPQSGEVRFQGQPVFAMRGSTLDAYRNRRVGFVFQFYHLLPELSALENAMVSAMIGRGLFTWGRERAAVRERAAALMVRLGLGERLKHRPNKLSGGERQRVAIARALINQPAVLLADEPTGNLDAKTGGEILDVLRELHAEGQAIVMVTHDAAVAGAADRRLRLEAGALRSDADG